MSSVPTSVTYIFNSTNWSTSPARAATSSPSGCARLTRCRTAGRKRWSPLPACLASRPTSKDTTDVVGRITTRIYATVNTIRTVHDAVDSDDPTTADILHTQIDALEKLAWLIKSENRKA